MLEKEIFLASTSSASGIPEENNQSCLKTIDRLLETRPIRAQNNKHSQLQRAMECVWLSARERERNHYPVVFWGKGGERENERERGDRE